MYIDKDHLFTQIKQVILFLMLEQSFIVENVHIKGGVCSINSLMQ